MTYSLSSDSEINEKNINNKYVNIKLCGIYVNIYHKDNHTTVIVINKMNTTFYGGALAELRKWCVILMC